MAIAALAAVQQRLPMLTLTAVKQGLSIVQWPGRLQIVHQGDDQSPTLLVDCAHNPDSALKLRHALTHDYSFNRLWLILGAPENKDVRGVMEQLLPLTAGVFMTTANHPRSATPEELVETSEALGVTAVATQNMTEAISSAWRQAAPDDLICVTGSIIVVGDLLNQWDNLKTVVGNQ